MNSLFNVKNKHSFQQMGIDRVMDHIRDEIEIFLLFRKTEEEYFSVEDINIKTIPISIYLKSMQEIAKELEMLGWGVKFAFGNTAMYIYSTPGPPSTYSSGTTYTT